MRSPFSKD